MTRNTHRNAACCIVTYSKNTSMYLYSNEGNIKQLHKQFPWEPPPFRKAPLLEGVHEVELQRLLHLRDLHVLHTGGALSLLSRLLALAGDVHARGKRKVEEVIASWGGGRGKGEEGRERRRGEGGGRERKGGREGGGREGGRGREGEKEGGGRKGWSVVDIPCTTFTCLNNDIILLHH